MLNPTSICIYVKYIYKHIYMLNPTSWKLSYICIYALFKSTGGLKHILYILTTYIHKHPWCPYLAVVSYLLLFTLSPRCHMLVSASLRVGRKIWTGGHCRDTVTFQGHVQQWDKAGGDFTERPHTQHSVPRLPLPGAFGTWPAHAETMQTSWMAGGGRGGRKVKNGRKKWGRARR